MSSPSSHEQLTRVKLYRPPTSQSVDSQPQDLPDSYFAPTAADLKAAQATLSARTNALVNAPLQLQANREAQEKAKRDRWPNTTIRIKFSDRTQLENTFPSTDKIRSVYAFVRNSLREDVRSIKFILYQSPPKRDLKVSDPQVRDLSLAELKLAPASVLLLRFEDDFLNGQSCSSIPAPLVPSILAEAVDLPSPPNFDTEVSQDSPPSTQRSSATRSREKKLPKWLKMNSKK